jgi:glycosyltransferase involved in cell wall biosynthesis
MNSRYKILFLGEYNHPNSLPLLDGFTKYGNFEITTWQLKFTARGWIKIFRFFEIIFSIYYLFKLVIRLKPDLIFGYRITSYGFLAAIFHNYSPIVIAQQGITDIYPENSLLVPLKKLIQNYAFKHSTLVHAWGEIMTYSMLKGGTNPSKIMVMPKGINLNKYNFTPKLNDQKIRAIVTRSLTEDYRHETIFKAFEIIKNRNIPFELTIIGDGSLKEKLTNSAKVKNIINDITFTGRIANSELPLYLSNNDLYISMPCTEGVSTSLFEAMAAGCYPIVSDLPGTQAWITDMKNGRLIVVDDVNLLVESIIWYYENRQDLSSTLYKNRETIEQEANCDNNMKVISNRYLEIIKEYKDNFNKTKFNSSI